MTHKDILESLGKLTEHASAVLSKIPSHTRAPIFCLALIIPLLGLIVSSTLSTPLVALACLLIPFLFVLVICFLFQPVATTSSLGRIWTIFRRRRRSVDSPKHTRVLSSLAEDKPSGTMRQPLQRSTKRPMVIRLSVASIIIGSIAAPVAQFGGTWFWRTASPIPSSDIVNKELEHFRIISVPPNDTLAAIGRAYGLPTDASDYKTFRSLHGLLMQKVARGKPGAVVWGLHFDGQSAADNEFIKGMQSLATESGTPFPLVIATRTVDTHANAHRARSIYMHAVSGSLLFRRSFDGITCFDSFIWKTDGRLLPSLPVLATMLFESGGRECLFSVSSWVPSPLVTIRRADRPDAIYDVLRPTYGAVISLDEQQFDLHNGDTALEWAYLPPDRRLLDECSVEYARVLAASDDWIESTLRGKLVIIADGRRVHEGVHAGELASSSDSIAGACASVKARFAISQPSITMSLFAAFSTSSVAIWIAFRNCNRDKYSQFMIFIVVLTIFGLIHSSLSVLLLRRFGYITNPAYTIMLFCISYALSAIFAARQLAVARGLSRPGP